MAEERRRLALLHGFAASAFTWRRLEPLLEPHEAVAIDRPWAAPADAATAVVEALTAMGWSGAVLVGHSAGAELSVLIASQHPELVSAAVLIAPVLDGGPPPVARLVAGAPGAARVAPAALRAAIRIGLKPALGAAWYDRSLLTPDVVEGYRAPLLAPGVTEALWEMTRQHRPLRLAEVVPTLRVPVHVIVGDHDRWATDLPSVSTTKISDCGHLPHEERPDEVAAAIHRFLATG